MPPETETIKTGFLSLLAAVEIGQYNGRAVWRLREPLYFQLSPGRMGIVPAGFETDLGSVPRLPLVWWLWGDRAHRECVWHDYCYRTGAYITLPDESKMDIPRDDADWYFRMAMISSNPAVQKAGQPYWIYQPIYLAVRALGRSSYHRMGVMDSFDDVR